MENSRVIKTSDLKIQKILGKGAFGQVYEVLDKVSGVRMALKVIAKAALSKRAYQATLDEQATLRLLTDSPWQLSLEGSWSDSHSFYMLMVRSLTCNYSIY